MSRQNFITKDFFVEASESETKQTLLSIPDYVNNIKFLGENSLVQSIKFLYERANDHTPQHVDVSLLPLNDKQTRVTLHVGYANGQLFSKDNYIINTLHNFESAISAAINGNISAYTPEEPRQNVIRRVVNGLVLTAATVGMFFIWKKLS
ncbi:MAG TPA: hypothetical protein VGD33_11910 [Chitinophagaceae bacterium]